MNTLGLQIGVVVVVAVSAAAWLKIHDSKVVSVERARVEQKSNANAEKANAARRSADKLPPDRLRDKFCRDC
jgi:hypothetical protein